MLKTISNLKGCVSLNKKQQQSIYGGAPKFCSHRRPCNLPLVCYNGICKLPA